MERDRYDKRMRERSLERERELARTKKILALVIGLAIAAVIAVTLIISTGWPGSMRTARTESETETEAATEPQEAITEALSDEEYAARARSLLDDTYDESELTGSNGYVPSEELTEEAATLIAGMATEGFHCGFMILDIRTGKVAALNSQQEFYAASASKAAYVVSLASRLDEISYQLESQMKDITMYSSNKAYMNLKNTYGFETFDEWCAEAGVTDMHDTGGYAFYSAEDLVRLWLKNYQYFITAEDGEQVAGWFETPETSAIATVLSEYVTQSKAGWYSSTDLYYNSSVDAGIVYAGDYPYILAVVSDYPDNVTWLNGLVGFLDKVHEEMTA